MTIGSAISYAMEHGLVTGELANSAAKRLKNGPQILRAAFKIPKNAHPIWMIRTGRSRALPQKMRTLRRSVDEVLKINAIRINGSERIALAR